MADINKGCLVTIVRPTDATCQSIKVDVTGDNIPEDIYSCGEVRVEWSGDSNVCNAKMKNIFGERGFGGIKGMFSSPLAILKRLGVAPSLCSDKTAELRKLVGLNARFDAGTCSVTPYGKQKWLLSYPPSKKRGLGVDDLRNEYMNKLPKFALSDRPDKKIGIGTWGVFKLRDGSEVTGVVVNIGFFETFGRPNGDGADFSWDAANIFIYTVDTKTYEVQGTKADLHQIEDVRELSPAEMKDLAVAYHKAHKSIQEMVDEMTKE